MNNWRWAGVGLAVVLVLSSTSAPAQERKKKRGVTQAEVRGAVTRYLSEVRPKALLPFLPLVDVQISGITYKASPDGDRLNWRVQAKVALKSRERKTVEAALLALLEAALVGRKQAVFSERYYTDQVEATITIVPPGPGRSPEKLPPVVGKKHEHPAPVVAAPVVAAPVVVFVPVLMPVAVIKPNPADFTWWQPPAFGSWYAPPPSGLWWELYPGAGQ